MLASCKPETHCVDGLEIEGLKGALNRSVLLGQIMWASNKRQAQCVDGQVCRLQEALYHTVERDRLSTTYAQPYWVDYLDYVHSVVGIMLYMNNDIR